MNRLARKYRASVPPQAKDTSVPQKLSVGLTFVIDRKGASAPQVVGDTEVVARNEVEELTVQEGVSNKSEIEKPSELEPKSKRKKGSLFEKETAALNHLESTVFNRAEKLADRLLDRASDQESSDETEESSDESDSNNVNKVSRKPLSVWTDDADEEERSAANRTKYEQLVGQPAWAVKAQKRVKKKTVEGTEAEPSGKSRPSAETSSSEDEADDDGFRKMRDYISNAVSSSSSADPSLATLPGGSLQFARCADLNQELRHFTEISSIDFYPLSTLALVASHDSTLKLFQVDGKQNSLIHSIVMKQWPIQCAKFNAFTQEIFLQCAIPQPSFYAYDLMNEKMTLYNRYRDQGCAPFRNMTLSPDGSLMAFSSRNGYVHIISTRTKELMFDLKRNGEIGGLTIIGNQLYASGDDSEVVVWDIRQQRCCLNRFNDSGCIHGTCLAASLDKSYLACGSDSGIINLYKLDSCANERDPKPIKVVKNIVTPVSGIVMNHSSELMMAWSSHAPRAIKALHVQSKAVFANFPESEDLRVKNVSAVALSPNSGYLAVGNHSGRVLLWRLRHFANY